VSNLKQTAAGAVEELIPTPAGVARLDWFPAPGQPRAVAPLDRLMRVDLHEVAGVLRS
jgi:hypothetical protein